MATTHALLLRQPEMIAMDEESGRGPGLSPTPPPEDVDAVTQRMAHLEERLRRAEEQALLAERRAAAAEQHLGIVLVKGTAVLVQPAERSGEAPLGRMASMEGAVRTGSPLAAGRPLTASDLEDDLPPPNKPPRALRR